MPSIRSLALFVVCVCLTACETPFAATDSVRAAMKREGVTIAGGDGSSFEKAIIIHAPNRETAILALYEYIILRYRLWQFKRHMLVYYKGKHYLVVTCYDKDTYPPTPTWKERVFYFDMNDYYRKSS